MEEEDWEQKYKQVLREFNKNEKLQEELKQENFILKRELSREKQTNKFISDELENLESKYAKDLSASQQNYKEKIERLSDEILSLKQTNQTLEERAQIEVKQEKVFVEVPCKCQNEKSFHSVSFDESHFNELVDLKQKFSNLEVELHEMTVKYESLIMENKDLCEKIEYLESSLQYKKDELVEKQEQEDLLHEKIMELDMELNSLRMQPNDQQKKGNSLFAEVDDQRQKFRKLLTDQNEQYKQMKRAYQDGQHEIRRLRRENNEILEEMESCKALFKASESTYKQGLLDKIAILEHVKDRLQNKVNVLENALAQGSSTQWVNAMLTYCNDETKNFKDKLFECLKQKSVIEENLLRAQQECAKFKFEASELKTKLRSCKPNEISSDPETNSINLSNHETDASVQDFLNELSNDDANETKENIPKENCVSVPKYQDIHVIEKQENVIQVKKAERATKVPIVIKKITIPSRSIKK
uniref:CSON013506 protein n=1 Tax=Culicoides sonorensis TaxID=179676 RepID=A0A336LSD1_CULSO